MRAIDGMRCADIATQTGVSKRAVEKRYARALLAVRKYMANPHDDA
jgi:DNA-directed RNA polymerase specialized sigma24 family protein